MNPVVATASALLVFSTAAVYLWALQRRQESQEIPAAKWDGLRVTFGQDMATSFKSQPRTVAEAESQGFVRVGPSVCGGSVRYNGIAYVKDGDYAVTLLFDINGFIAGIQAGVLNEEFAGVDYPSPNIQPPFVPDGSENNRLTLTAYFTDPSKICTEGRTQANFDVQGTGNNLWLQTGPFATDVTLVPRNQGDIGAPWVEGQCFQGMGQHYWYNTTVDMNCDDFVPIFLLYNGGDLNAFGWAMGANLNSPHYEHPVSYMFNFFFKTVPQCLYELPALSTMHIYMTSTPWTNAC